MTIDYDKFSQMVTPIVAAVPAIVYLLKQINITPGTRYAGIGLANDSSSIPIFKDFQKPFAFTW